MTQQNCRPCQGIQSLTPIPLRNSPGQKQLRYRVGTYEEFFESMLAALSRGHSRTGANTSQDVLRYLTAREKDDPSIATLDAWAVLADVLTFYNERYMDEAFLRTAKQSSSLHELANIVGYTPRPGLSSSVYLSFEVDERSSEVLIPAGTQAKSTPIPGSGETSETFETVSDFIARPSLNKIRPRLTRPYDLAIDRLRDLNSITLMGTGLRIQPNDYIAIGDPSVGQLSLKKVIQIEERRESILGAITLLWFEADELSPSRLVDDVTAVIERLMRDTQVAQFFVTDFAKEQFEIFAEQLSSARRASVANGLLGTDESIHSNVVLELLVREKPETLTLPTFSTTTSNKWEDKSLRKIINAISEHCIGSRKISGLATEHLANAVLNFGKVHEELAKVLLNKSEELPTANITASEILDCERRIYRIAESASESFPKIYLGIERGPEIFSGNQLFPNLTLSRDIDEQKVDLKFSVTKGMDDIDDLKEIDLREVQDTLRTINLDVSPENEWGYIFFSITNGNNFIGAGVQRFKTKSNATGGIAPHETHFFPKEGDQSFDLVLDKPEEEGWSYTTKHLENNHSSKTIQISKTAQRVSIECPGDVRSTLLITIMKEGAPVAYAIRVLIRDDKPVFLRRLAAEISAASDPLTVKARLKALAERVAKVGSDNKVPENFMTDAAKLTTLLNAITYQSDSINKDEKILYGETYNDFCLSVAKKQLIEDKLPEIKTSSVSTLKALANVSSTAMLTEAANSLSDATDISKWSDAFLKFHLQCLSLEQDASTVHKKFFEAVDDVWDELQKRRKVIVETLDKSSQGFVKSIEPSSVPAEESLRNRLKLLFNESVEFAQSIKRRVMPGVLVSESSTADEVEATLSSVKEIAKKAKEVRDSGEDGLTPAILVEFEKLKEQWDEFLKSLGLSEAARQGSPTLSADSLADLLSRAQSLNPRNLGANSIADLLGENSALWPQLLAALDPQQTEQIFNFIRSFRMVALPADGNLGLWVFRSQANLFGWNSSGNVTTTTDGRVTTISHPDFVANLDPKSVVLDGKLSKTIVGSPIAIRTTSSSPPVGYWPTRVTLEPHTAYNLSNESTKIEVLATSPWYGTSASDFKVIRGTKVFCDADELSIGESLLAESQTEYFLDGEEIELDGFYPEFASGNRVTVSGIPSPVSAIEQPENNSSSSASSTILCQIKEVVHIPPKVHGEKVHTTLRLQRPLPYRVWRSSVEICANIIEATHGETVVETLGNGDACKSFQNFRLSRGPVTRLPAPNASGKMEALEVKVNSTRWNKVDQLVDSKNRDEVFELRGNRNHASTTLQFGNGIHGTRLPTGIENVKAIYRAGLGVSGNVQAGQINQLPSPPFGVKAVSNPTNGDGGANADSIPQTRLRVPALAESMGRLVSKRDFENFALLFAGIDKVSIVELAGEMILTIAGTTPAPLSTDGQLFRNFIRALALQGEAASQVKVETYAGLLLHIRAQVFVESRYDWALVKSEIETKLMQRYGYAAMRLGEVVLASEVVEVIQSVQHVRYARLQELLGLASTPGQAGRSSTRRSSARSEPGKVYPKVDVFSHEVCYIDAQVSSTVQLERLQ